MHIKDWEKFIANGQGQEIEIAQVSQATAMQIGAGSSNVILHHDCVMKAINKHNMKLDEFPMIIETIDYGIAIADRPSHLTFFHFDDKQWHAWFQVTIKRATENKCIYVCTFHKQHRKKVSSKLKKYPIIK
jgi:hypothetical protein